MSKDIYTAARVKEINILRKILLSLIVIIALAVAFAPASLAAASDGDAVSPGDAAPYENNDSQQAEMPAEDVQIEYYRAQVLKIISDEEDTISGEGYEYVERTQTLRVRLLEGPCKGRIAVVSYNLTDTWGGGNGTLPVRAGSKVIVQLDEGKDGILSGIVVQYVRQNALLWLGLIFVALLAFFGGKRGLRSLLALVVSCVGLIFIMVPLVVNGFNPVWAAVLASVFAICTTLILVYGFTIKTLAAAVGSVGGVVIAGVITAIMNVVMNMTGLVDDESMYLAQSVAVGETIDLRGILFAAIIISVLGGTIDVGISIASALDEMRLQAKGITGARMMESGINIGIDIMGASLNTLILSYVGGSLHLLMIFYTYDSPMVMIINDEMIVCEILRALAGSFGLLLTVPVTAFVASMMMCKGNFGKLSADCFSSVTLCKRFIARIKALKTGPKREKPNKPDEKPDDLYQIAHERSERMRFDETNGNSDDAKTK